MYRSNIATIAFISFTRPNAETDQISYLQDLSVITRAMARPIGRQIITMNARNAQSSAFMVWKPRYHMARYIYRPGTMITIDGTVRQMRG